MTKINEVKYLKDLLKAALIVSCFAGDAYATIISSTFDSNNEGWQILGDSTSSISTYVTTGGNPGGFVQANDRVAGGVWYFNAPSKFLGNVSGAYGQSLLFDLNQTGSGPQFNAADVILNGGGLQLTYDTGSNPLPLGQWVSYSVIFNESGGWLNGSVSATQADMLVVLGSLDRLRIRGEFITGSDEGALDNVSVKVVPIPAAIWLLGSSLIGLLSLRIKNTV